MRRLCVILFCSLCVTQVQAEAPPQKFGRWTVITSKDKVDDTIEVIAINVISTSKRGDPGSLAIGCKKNKTHFLVQSSGYWGRGNLTVIYRLNSDNAVRLVWESSADGASAFYPSATVPFIKSLPDTGRLFFRVHDFRGIPYEAEFPLEGVEEVKKRIGAACSWKE